MKKIKKPYLLSALLLATFVMACHDDTITDEPAVKGKTSSVQFQSVELAIAENVKDYIIKLPLAGKATKAGEIIISVNATKSAFDLKPAAREDNLHLPVAVNDESVQFSIIPKDNTIIDGDVVVEFTIAQTSEGIVLGDKKSLKLTITDNEIPTTANFSIDKTSIKETVTNGIELSITLSAPAPGTGTLNVSAQSDLLVYNHNYITQPAAENGILTLPVKEGDTQLSFRILPVDDARFNGSRELKLSLTTAEGVVSRGLNKEHTLTITDDELSSKPKGYTSGDGFWSVKREYIYDEVSGRIKEVHWEQNTPGTLKGVDHYQYDNSGKLIGMKLNAVDQVVFTWEENRIVKKERFRENVLKEYSLYGYDQAGNIGEVSDYYVQKDGSMPMSFRFVYLYYNDGNLYKQLTYQPIEGKDEEYVLISTKTYEHYINISNPFTMVNILPNVNSQPNLATTYRIEANGTNTLYELSYELDEEGKPIRRTARSGNTSEKVSYYYY
ncbi:MAG: hypothetical protein C0523_02020 [Cytophaga sp.]|nr:hypothetical protein [Cytophaga sp.]